MFSTPSKEYSTLEATLSPSGGGMASPGADFSSSSISRTWKVVLRRLAAFVPANEFSAGVETTPSGKDAGLYVRPYCLLIGANGSDGGLVILDRHLFVTLSEPPSVEEVVERIEAKVNETPGAASSVRFVLTPHALASTAIVTALSVKGFKAALQFSSASADASFDEALRQVTSDLVAAGAARPGKPLPFCEPNGLISVPGMTAELARAFYGLAWKMERLAPWTTLVDSQTLKLDYAGSSSAATGAAAPLGGVTSAWVGTFGAVGTEEIGRCLEAGLPSPRFPGLRLWFRAKDAARAVSKEIKLYGAGSFGWDDRFTAGGGEVVRGSTTAAGAISSKDALLRVRSSSRISTSPMRVRRDSGQPSASPRSSVPSGGQLASSKQLLAEEPVPQEEDEGDDSGSESSGSSGVGVKEVVVMLVPGLAFPAPDHDLLESLHMTPPTPCAYPIAFALDASNGRRLPLTPADMTWLMRGMAALNAVAGQKRLFGQLRQNRLQLPSAGVTKILRPVPPPPSPFAPVPPPAPAAAGPSLPPWWEVAADPALPSALLAERVSASSYDEHAREVVSQEVEAAVTSLRLAEEAAAALAEGEAPPVPPTAPGGGRPRAALAKLPDMLVLTLTNEPAVGAYGLLPAQNVFSTPIILRVTPGTPFEDGHRQEWRCPPGARKSYYAVLQPGSSGNIRVELPRGLDFPRVATHVFVLASELGPALDASAAMQPGTVHQADLRALFFANLACAPGVATRGVVVPIAYGPTSAASAIAKVDVDLAAAVEAAEAARDLRSTLLATIQSATKTIADLTAYITPLATAQDTAIGKDDFESAQRIDEVLHNKRVQLEAETQKRSEALTQLAQLRLSGATQLLPPIAAQVASAANTLADAISEESGNALAHAGGVSDAAWALAAKEEAVVRAKDRVAASLAWLEAERERTVSGAEAERGPLLSELEAMKVRLEALKAEEAELERALAAKRVEREASVVALGNQETLIAAREARWAERLEQIERVTGIVKREEVAAVVAGEGVAAELPSLATQRASADEAIVSVVTAVAGMQTRATVAAELQTSISQIRAALQARDTAASAAASRMSVLKAEIDGPNIVAQRLTQAQEKLLETSNSLKALRAKETELSAAKVEAVSSRDFPRAAQLTSELRLISGQIKEAEGAIPQLQAKVLHASQRLSDYDARQASQRAEYDSLRSSVRSEWEQRTREVLGLIEMIHLWLITPEAQGSSGARGVSYVATAASIGEEVAAAMEAYERTTPMGTGSLLEGAQTVKDAALRMLAPLRQALESEIAGLADDGLLMVPVPLPPPPSAAGSGAAAAEEGAADAEGGAEDASAAAAKAKDVATAAAAGGATVSYSSVNNRKARRAARLAAQAALKGQVVAPAAAGGGAPQSPSSATAQ